jgi:cyanophycinase
MRTLMPIGGAMDREDARIMREFVRRAGGKRARIVILPQASALEESGAIYVQQCLDLGAKEAVALEFRRRDLADTPENLRLVRRASGIFFTGGAQMRITNLIGGTQLEKELLQAYQRGCVVGGTSAGASVLSKTMIAYGKSGPTPRERIVQLTAGLGFTDAFTFDQHFRQRDRLGRLIYVVASQPGILGVGLDEDTAAIVEDDSRLIVFGSAAITVVDGRDITASDIAEIEKGGVIAVANLKVHVLTEGCTYDARRGEVSLPPKVSLNE